MTKHFFKVLSLFLVMIILGLIGVFAVNYFDDGTGQATNTNNQTPVAK